MFRISNGIRTVLETYGKSDRRVMEIHQFKSKSLPFFHWVDVCMAKIARLYNFPANFNNKKDLNVINPRVAAPPALLPGFRLVRAPPPS